LQHAIAMGWLVLHESGTFIQFTRAGCRRIRVSNIKVEQLA
jgi:hypothetical protein